MINIHIAKQKVLDQAKHDLGGSLPFEIAIFEEYIIESEHGWIIPWNSKEFIETGDFMKAVSPGLGRLGITKTGKTVHFMSGYNDDQCLEKIKEENEKK